MAVDAHLHLLPLRLGQAIRAFFAEHGVPEDTWRYPLDHDEVCDRLAAEGVSEGWNLPYARRPGTAAALNASSAEVVARRADGPVRVIGGATVHPGDDEPAALVRQAVEDLGLRALKLHCSVGAYRPDDPRLDPVWSYVSAVRLPVVIHAGHATSGHTTVAELEPIATVARRWPEARLVVAHCGFDAMAATLDLVESHPGVHADLTPVVQDPLTLPMPRAAPLAGKLLFGSDCPNAAITVTDGLGALDRLGLEPDALEAIRGGNARRLQADVLT